MFVLLGQPSWELLGLHKLFVDIFKRNKRFLFEESSIKFDVLILNLFDLFFAECDIKRSYAFQRFQRLFLLVANFWYFLKQQSILSLNLSKSNLFLIFFLFVIDVKQFRIRAFCDRFSLSNILKMIIHRALMFSFFDKFVHIRCVFIHH